jgi:hypothetical protein
VPTPDDERFEAYLKQFRPLAPDPLPTEERGRASRRWSALRAWIAATAAILILGAISMHIRPNRVAAPNTATNVASAEQLVPLQPLTMRSANALLATAPSFKAAVDNMAFRSQTLPVPKGKQSAVAVLGKEKIKL